VGSFNVEKNSKKFINVSRKQECWFIWQQNRDIESNELPLWIEGEEKKMSHSSITFNNDIERKQKLFFSIKWLCVCSCFQHIVTKKTEAKEKKTIWFINEFDKRKSSKLFCE
jgi:hypothetical protein